MLVPARRKAQPMACVLRVLPPMGGEARVHVTKRGQYYSAQQFQEKRSGANTKKREQKRVCPGDIKYPRPSLFFLLPLRSQIPPSLPLSLPSDTLIYLSLL